MTTFHSHVLKFQRARQHLKDLRINIRDWFQSGHHAEWFEDDPHTPNNLLIKACADEIPENPFSLLIGDVVQNLRGCLDHLAFALALAHTNPLPEEIASDSQFPIVGNINRKGEPTDGAQSFESQRKAIRGICPRAQTVIEGLQPYHRGNDFQADPLWRLISLSNIDKHRILHVAIAYPSMFTVNPNRYEFSPLVYPNAKTKTFSSTGARVERDTVIGEIGIERWPDPNVKVELEIEPSIAFSEGIAIHEDVVRVLEDIETHLMAFVLPPLTPFLTP